jgi:hypothetical protein
MCRSIRLLSFFLLLLSFGRTAGQQPDSISGEHIRLARQLIDTGLIIQAKYGFGRMRHIDFTGSYADNRLVEFHIGWRNRQSISALDIPGLRQTSLFYGSTTTSDQNANGRLASESARFGMRTSSGYGWVSSTGMLLPYSSSSIVWTKLKGDATLLGGSDSSILRDFRDVQRFGNAIESGVELISENGLAVRVGVERTLVFPRHLAFKELVSSIIQGGLADAVGETSARAVGSRITSPLVSFILSSAIRFGISELRREEMNWPFDSAPPLVFDTFEVGLAYTF